MHFSGESRTKCVSCNYISPLFTENGDCILFTDYQDQLVEAEARAFANLFDGKDMVA